MLGGVESQQPALRQLKPMVDSHRPVATSKPTDGQQRTNTVPPQGKLIDRKEDAEGVPAAPAVSRQEQPAGVEKSGVTQRTRGGVLSGLGRALRNVTKGKETPQELVDQERNAENEMAMETFEELYGCDENRRMHRAAKEAEMRGDTRRPDR